MTRLEIRPFSDEFLAPAGELLAARHRAHRAAEPLLPARYEERRGRSRRGRGAPATRTPRAPSRFADGARRRLPARASRKSDDLGRERLGRDRRPRGRGGRGPARPVRRGGRALGRGGPRPPLRARPGDGSSPGRGLVAGRASGSSTRTASARCRTSPWPDGVRLAEERDVDALVELAPLLAGPPVAVARSSASACRARRRRRSAPRSSKTCAKPELGDLVAERDGRIVGAVPDRPGRAVERAHRASRARRARHSSAGRRRAQTCAVRAPGSR